MNFSRGHLTRNLCRRTDLGEDHWGGPGRVGTRETEKHGGWKDSNWGRVGEREPENAAQSTTGLLKGQSGQIRAARGR